MTMKDYVRLSSMVVSGRLWVGKGFKERGIEWG